MYSVKDLSELYSVSKNTVKNWASEFGDYLSTEANTAPRSFTEEDLTVLTLISHLRRQGKSYKAVQDALRNGDRMDPPAEAGYTDEKSTSIFARFTSTIARYEGQLETTQKSLEDELKQHERTRKQLLDAEKRATRYEVERDILKSQLDELAEYFDEDEEKPRRWWWQRFRREDD